MRREILEEITLQILPLHRQYRDRVGKLRSIEKPDRTILTEADIAIQQEIVKLIRNVEPTARIVAEEAGTPPTNAETAEITWVIDPIDGTAQFIKKEAREFCTVVARVISGTPDVALFVAPELAKKRAPLVIAAFVPEAEVYANGKRISLLKRDRSAIQNLSVTRSKGTEPRPLELAASKNGFSVKHRTTSQSLDLLRLFLDLRDLTDLPLTPFEIFYRESQWLWDGIGGLALAAASGYWATDLEGVSLLPLSEELLSSSSPKLPHCLIATEEGRSWLLRNISAG